MVRRRYSPLVNGQGVDYVHSRVQVKAPVVGHYISKLKGENVVGPMDVFASLTNYSRDGIASIGFWNVISQCLANRGGGLEHQLFCVVSVSALGSVGN